MKCKNNDRFRKFGGQGAKTFTISEAYINRALGGAGEGEGELKHKNP